jgi:hypothetical protein
MKRLLRCDCGFEARADDEGELIAEVQRHALDAHGMKLTPEEVRRLALQATTGTTTGQPPPAKPKGGAK